MHKTCKSVNQFWIHKGVARNAELKQQKEEEKERRKQEREQKKLKNEREKELKKIKKGAMIRGEKKFVNEGN